MEFIIDCNCKSRHEYGRSTEAKCFFRLMIEMNRRQLGYISLEGQTSIFQLLKLLSDASQFHPTFSSVQSANATIFMTLIYYNFY